MSRFFLFFEKGVLCLLCVAGLACSSARLSQKEADALFRQGRYRDAALELKKGLEKEGENSRDELLYFLDMGLSYHSAGLYEESNAAFFRAEKLAEIKDYTSLSTEAATLVVSSNIRQYSGEDFEKVLINTYLAMNFALMGKFEDALVEARRVNHILHRMVTEGKRPYQQNAFALYLAAILYESQGDYNDAYVDYQAVHALWPTYSLIGQDLWRCAKTLRIPEDQKKWDQLFHLTAEDHERSLLAQQKSEIIILYENGMAPLKRPHPDSPSLPKFYPRYNPVSTAKVKVQGRFVGQTHLLNDIQATAIHDLDEKWNSLVTQKVLGDVAKGTLGFIAANRTKSPFLGLLAFFFLKAQDEADLRSWYLLPKDLQILRIPVDPGTYTVEVLPKGSAQQFEKGVQVEPHKKVFANFRYMP